MLCFGCLGHRSIPDDVTTLAVPNPIRDKEQSLTQVKQKAGGGW